MSLIDLAQSELIKTDLDKCLFHCIVDSKYYRPFSKKNGRPIYKSRGAKARPFIGKSNELVAQELILAYEFKRKKPAKPLEGYIHCMYHFHFGPDISRSFHLCDLSNLFEIVSDSLQNAGVIANDRFIMSFDGSRKTLSPKSMLEVFILKYGL